MFPWRFEFTAREPIDFPEGKAANVLRGAFGSIFRRLACRADCPGAKECPARDTCDYARIFEPRAHGAGPSGLADWPRPFVFRAAHLDGKSLLPGETFCFDLHVFDAKDPALARFVRTFAEIAQAGLGSRRGRAVLRSVWQLGTDGARAICVWETGAFRVGMIPDPLRVPLTVAASDNVNTVTVQFLTPTELKAGDRLVERPEFSTLFGRARDRVSTLMTLYGEGGLDLDFRDTGASAARIMLIRFDLRHADTERRSSRTGQVHPLGGFVGSACYEGDLAEFLPILRAASWTGVGRQTVWGKGHIKLLR